jgi:hypothetical protein
MKKILIFNLLLFFVTNSLLAQTETDKKAREAIFDKAIADIFKTTAMHVFENTTSENLGFKNGKPNLDGLEANFNKATDVYLELTSLGAHNIINALKASRGRDEVAIYSSLKIPNLSVNGKKIETDKMSVQNIIDNLTVTFTTTHSSWVNKFDVLTPKLEDILKNAVKEAKEVGKEGNTKKDDGNTKEKEAEVEYTRNIAKDSKVKEKATNEQIPPAVMGVVFTVIVGLVLFFYLKKDRKKENKPKTNKVLSKNKAFTEQGKKETSIYSSNQGGGYKKSAEVKRESDLETEKNTLKKEIERLNAEVAELKAEKSDLNATIVDLRAKISNQKPDVRTNELEERSTIADTSKSKPSKGGASQKIKETFYVYLPTRDGRFDNKTEKEIEPTETPYQFFIFEKPDKKGNNGEFEFINDEYCYKGFGNMFEDAIEPACTEIDGSSNSSTKKIRTTKRGKIRKDGDGWRVTQKAEIIYE